MKRIFTQLLASVTLLISLLSSQNLLAQTSVVIPGSFQSELGCAGDWDPTCDNTRLLQTGPFTWEGSFLVPAGTWYYKVVHDDSWAENYGAGGVPGGADIELTLAVATLMHFTYFSNTHLVDVQPALPPGPLAVTVVGSFQSELGCAGDWDPSCWVTNLFLDAASNTWFGLFNIPPGNWEYKITINNSWAENYGDGGVPGGPNIPLIVSGDKKILFRYNPVTHLVTTNIVDYNVNLAGDFLDEIGCASDWMPDCIAATMNFDLPYNLWRKDLYIPAGSYQFKITIDNSWAENYGDGGVPGGPNINLNLPGFSKVVFTYDPVTHLVNFTIQSETVVLPGNFQDELGCAGDWDPACDNTRLVYDPVQKLWTGTFDIPAGNWEFKVAHNNSWNENYGLYGIPNGPNIPLSLDGPYNITFNYDPVTHWVSFVYNTTSVCAQTFYDANTNGWQDYDEPPLEGVEIRLQDQNVVQYTDVNGKTCFYNLSPGIYTLREEVFSGYYPTNPDSQTVDLTYPQTLYFGSVCLGGAGAMNQGYWMNKQGKTEFNNLDQWQQDYILGTLRYFNLRNADGSDFDPNTYDELSAWMKRGNAKNMTYKLSVGLAVLYLNSEVRQLSGRYIYTPGISYWGYQTNFMNVGTVCWYINQFLFAPTSYGGDASRDELEMLKNMLEKANSDLSFVQLQPCTNNAITTRKYQEEQVLTENKNQAVIWPNPSNSFFTLQAVPDGVVDVRVLDVTGKLVYKNRVTNKNLQFGEDFKPGLYLVEIIQGENKVTMKIIKH